MLQGRVAIVTGGGSGIGQAAAFIMAREGAKVVIGDISEGGGMATVQQTQAQGGEALFRLMDVTREEHVVNLVDTAVRHFVDWIVRATTRVSGIAWLLWQTSKPKTGLPS